MDCLSQQDNHIILARSHSSFLILPICDQSIFSVFKNIPIMESLSFSLHSNLHALTLLQHSKQNKTRRKITHQNSLALTPWTSHTQHRLYSSNLLLALRRNSNPTASLQVRAAADRVLAATAKGRTRWSRAILANPFGRWRKQRQRHHKKVKNCSANKCMKKTTPEIRRRLPAVQKKARVLGKLIPGCRKVSFPKLLEEAGDYISALEMQVRAMKALADLLPTGAPPPDPIGLSWPKLFIFRCFLVYR